MITIEAKLIAIKEGLYTELIFENVNPIEHLENRFIKCIKLPNWEFNMEISTGQIGYLTYEKAISGEKYFRREDEDYDFYKHNAFYMKSFIIKPNNQIIRKYKI